MKRIRGRQLQRIRTAHLQANPLCVHCEAKGRTTIATQVDHIQSLANHGEESRDPMVNRQGLCDECHRDKTQIDMGYRIKRAIGLDGWPLD